MVMRLSHPTAHLCPEIAILSDPNYGDTVFIFHMYYICMHLKSTSELKKRKVENVLKSLLSPYPYKCCVKGRTEKYKKCKQNKRKTQ